MHWKAGKTHIFQKALLALTLETRMSINRRDQDTIRCVSIPGDFLKSSPGTQIIATGF
jgi:hypothetical protein